MQNTKYLVMLQAFFVRGFFNTMTLRVMCLVDLNIGLKMSHILQTSFENGKLNDSIGLQNKLSLIVEFSLFDRKIETKVLSTSPGITIFFGILLLIMETLGNFLLFCMVWYEKFGMDSKKRTITNQLLSRMILALICFSIFFMPLHFSALLIPFSKYFQGSYD